MLGRKKKLQHWACFCCVVYKKKYNTKVRQGYIKVSVLLMEYNCVGIDVHKLKLQFTPPTVTCFYRENQNLEWLGCFTFPVYLWWPGRIQKQILIWPIINGTWPDVVKPIYGKRNYRPWWIKLLHGEFLETWHQDRAGWPTTLRKYMNLECTMNLAEYFTESMTVGS